MTKTRDELDTMTKEELVNYADDQDIDVNQHWVKDDIVKEILKSQKAAAAKPDSIKHQEANKAKIREENKQNEMVDKETAENQEIANFKGLPQPGETRDDLLARIRKMRDEDAKIQEGMVEVEIFRSEAMQKEFDAEQKAGQEAVSKAAAEQEKYRTAWQKEEAEGEKK